MVKKFKQFLKILIYSKFKFSTPSKKVIFFDDESFERYAQSFDYILKTKDYFIFKTRLNKIDEIFITPKIIFYVAYYFFKKNKLKISYFIAIILSVNPKIVLTIIHNSMEFSLVAKQLGQKFRFIAIQNASMYGFDEPNCDIEKKKKFFIPEFACFGKYEIDLYKKHNIEVKKFHVIGSLQLSQYLEQRKKTYSEVHDICLILEESAGWNKIFQGFEDAIGLIASHTIRFARENDLKLVLVGKRFGSRALEQEKKFYQKYIGKDFKILKKTIYSSYEAVEKSKISIGMMSTLLRESLALNRKVLSCNFTGSSAWNFPLKGACTLNDSSYESFKNRVKKILNLDYNSYARLIDHAPSYSMSLDANCLSGKKLKNILQSSLPTTL